MIVSILLIVVSWIEQKLIFSIKVCCPINRLTNKRKDLFRMFRSQLRDKYSPSSLFSGEHDFTLNVK